MGVNIGLNIGMNTIGMYHYLFLGLLIFLVGLLGSFLAKNVIKVLIAIEFMLTGININFVTFGTYCDSINYHGYVAALFYVGIGAVELAVAVYIFYLMYQKKKSDNIEDYGEL